MTSRYVVFQFHPDPVSDERINIGVAAYGREGLHVRFLRDWKRVRSFAGGDVKFLRDFERNVLKAADKNLTLFADAEATSALFEKAPARWINAIQVTAPRASTKPSDQLVDDVARRFLRTRVPAVART